MPMKKTEREVPAFVAVLAAVLVAMVMMGSSHAQTPQNPPRPNPVIGPVERILAESVERDVDGQGMKFRGLVVMQLDDVTITADEVDARKTPGGSFE